MAHRRRFPRRSRGSLKAVLRDPAQAIAMTLETQHQILASLAKLEEAAAAQKMRSNKVEDGSRVR